MEAFETLSDMYLGGILFSTVHLVWHILDRSHKLISLWFPTKTLSAGSGNLVGNQYKAPKRRRYPLVIVSDPEPCGTTPAKAEKNIVPLVIETLEAHFFVKNVYHPPKPLRFLRHFCWMIDTLAPQDSMKTTSPR